MMNKSCALIRASNLIVMDYPFEASLTSAMGICDEAVIVVGQSWDGTYQYVSELAKQFRGRVKIFSSLFKYDLGWQERWWTFAQDQTDAEWLLYWDADEVFHERDFERIKGMMQNPDVCLVSFPFHHFYMTNKYERGFPPRATRLGRRSVGYRMRNWRSDEMPNAPACMMVYSPDGVEIDAHNISRDGMAVMQTPIYHYSWCRTPLARSYSNHKMVDWYSGGRTFGLTSGEVPDVPPHDFIVEMPNLIYEGLVWETRITEHPMSMKAWSDAHSDGWDELETALYNARIGLGE